MTLHHPVFAAASTVRNEVTRVPISGISHSRQRMMRTDLVIQPALAGLASK
jgi:hypothetical protein